MKNVINKTNKEQKKMKKIRLDLEEKMKIIWLKRILNRIIGRQFSKQLLGK